MTLWKINESVIGGLEIRAEKHEGNTYLKATIFFRLGRLHFSEEVKDFFPFFSDP